MPSDRGTSFACDRCGLEGFRTYDDAASHESQCGPPPPQPPPPPPMGGGPMGGGGGGGGPMMGMMGGGYPPMGGPGGMGGPMMGMGGPMMGGVGGGGGGGMPMMGMGSPPMQGMSPAFPMASPSPSAATATPGSTDQRKRRRPGSPSPMAAPMHMQAAMMATMPAGGGGGGGGGGMSAFREVGGGAPPSSSFGLPRLVLCPEEDLRSGSSNLCLGLSDVDSLACRHIEAFRASGDDVAKFEALPILRRGPRTPREGDVGVRCVHCARDPGGGRLWGVGGSIAEGRGQPPAVLFPDTIGALPDDLRRLAEGHLPNCPSATESGVAEALLSERRSDGDGQGGGGAWRRAALLDYCIDFCRRGGIVDKSPISTGLTLREAEGEMAGGPGEGTDIMAPTPLMSRRERKAQQQAAAAGAGAGEPRPQSRGSPADSSAGASGSGSGGRGSARPPSSQSQQGPPGPGPGQPPGQQLPGPGRGGPGPPGPPPPPPPPDNFPFFHDGYSAWICKYCCSAPYPFRAPGSVLQGPMHMPPDPGYVESHVRACRGGPYPPHPPPPGGGEGGQQQEGGMPGYPPPPGPPRGYPGGPGPPPGQGPPFGGGPPRAPSASQEGQEQPPGPPMGGPPPPPHPYYPPHPPPYMGMPYPPPHMMGYEGGGPPGGPPPPMMPPGMPPGGPGPPGPPGGPQPPGGGPGDPAASGSNAALRTAIDYLDGAERMRLRLEADAAAEAARRARDEGGSGAEGAAAVAAAMGASPMAAATAPPPPTENVELVVPDDKLLLTDYFYHLMRQLKLCRFSESDRKTRGGKRENVPVGYGGLQCVHCAGAPNSRKFFWSNVDRLANSFAEIPGHVLKCRRCPARTKGALQELKLRHPEQMAKLPRGSQKVFFRRMWRRLHDDDPQQGTEGKEGEGKAGGAAVKKEDEQARLGAKPPAVTAAAVASPAASAPAGSSRTPTGRGDEHDVGDLAAGTLQGVFATPIAPRGARSGAAGPGGGDIAAEEEEEEEGGPSPRKRVRTMPAAATSPQLAAAAASRGSPAALVVSGTTAESARALADSASLASSRRGRRRPRVLLAIDEDKEWLSDTDCFVRSNVEAFVATARDVEQARLDRKYPISEGQVGIRCLHCASTADDAPEEEDDAAKEREDDKTIGARGNAVSYPYSISGIYEAVREFQRLHLESCKNLTPEVRSRLLGHQGSASLSSVLRRYYVMAAKALGMADTNDGIRASGESVTVGRGAAFEFASGGLPGTSGGGGKAKAGAGGKASGTPSPATIPRPPSASETPLSRGIEGLGGMMGMATPGGLGMATPGGGVMGMGSPLVGTPASQTPPHLLGRPTPGGPGPTPHHLGPPQASSAAGAGQAQPPPFGGMGLESAMTPLEGRKRKAASKAPRTTPPSAGGKDGGGGDGEGTGGGRKKRG